MVRELEFIHPQIERRLKQLGWSYIHERGVSRSGGVRVDFLAFDGIRYRVIECKRDSDYIERAIWQAWRYAALIQAKSNEYYTLGEWDVKSDESCAPLMLSARYAYWDIIPCVALPKYACESDVQSLCDQSGVTLWAFDILPETAVEASKTFLKPRR